MVASGNTKSSREVVCNCPDGSVQSKRCPDSLNAAIYRNANDEGNVEPVNVFIPVRLGHRQLSDMYLLGIIFRVWV